MSNGPMNSFTKERKAAPRKWRVKAPERSWNLLGKSSSGPTKNLNQDHVPRSHLSSQLFVLFPRTPFFLFMTVILVNYSNLYVDQKHFARNKTKYNSFLFTATGYIVSNCLAAHDWFSKVLTRKPQSKQTTTALDQKSRFFSTTIFWVLTNFGEFILPQYLINLRAIWRVIWCVP